MGWLFTHGSTRQGLIRERTANWKRTTDDGVLVKTTCLAHCFRGGRFSGVLWAVWEPTFSKDGHEVQPTERWIACDLLRYQMGYGWGYKDLDESMHPYYYSCPLGYLEMVPVDQYGGNEQWREGVKATMPGVRKSRSPPCSWISNRSRPASSHLLGLAEPRPQQHSLIGRPTLAQPPTKRRSDVTDPTETIRKELVAKINFQPGSREALEAEHGEVWDTNQLRETFEVLGFAAPLVVVRRRSDGQKGSLLFQASPRYYFAFDAHK
jgi:hypothetical protein